jgi:hypothetical protein
MAPKRCSSLTAIALSCAALLLIGCGATVGDIKDDRYYDVTGTWIPSWTMGHLPYAQEGGLRDVLQAVGVAPKMANPSLARKAATDAGRQEMARILGATVQSMVKTWEQEHTDFFEGGGNSSINYYEGVGRTVTDGKLIGSTARVHYVHPKTGLHYTLMELARNDAIEDALSMAREEARRRKTAFVEGKVDDAMDELDEVLRGMKPEDYYANTRVAD